MPLYTKGTNYPGNPQHLVTLCFRSLLDRTCDAAKLPGVCNCLQHHLTSNEIEMLQLLWSVWQVNYKFKHGNHLSLYQQLLESTYQNGKSKNTHQNAKSTYISLILNLASIIFSLMSMFSWQDSRLKSIAMLFHLIWYQIVYEFQLALF